MIERDAGRAWPNGRGRREPAPNADEAGPKARLVEKRWCVLADYQLPPDGQEPLPAVPQLRVIAPDVASFVIVNVLPEAEPATIL
jgi:hypothetical protein